MPIASLSTTSISLPALAREGRGREGLESREGPSQLDVDEQRSQAKLPRRADQPDDSTQADRVLVEAAQEQQFLETFASQRARQSSVSVPFENVSATFSTQSLSTTESHALRSYQQTQNINTANAPAGSELIVGIDTFV